MKISNIKNKIGLDKKWKGIKINIFSNIYKLQ